MNYPELVTTIGKIAKTKDPDGTIVEWDVIDEIRKNEYDEKIFIFQRLQRKNNDEELEMYRFGYYIIGKKPKMLGKWVWGQFAPFFTSDDFVSIMKEAKSKGWFTKLFQLS